MRNNDEKRRKTIEAGFMVKYSIQCRFKLTGRNALNLKFTTHFPLFGLLLCQKRWGQHLLKLSAKNSAFCFEKVRLNFSPQTGSFLAFFRNLRRKKNRSTTGITISKRTFHVAQQLLRKVSSPDIAWYNLFCYDRQEKSFLIQKTSIPSL